MFMLDEDPIPAGLLRRLAEAVDGYRKGTEAFFKVSRNPVTPGERDYEISEPLTRAQAQELAGSLGSGHRIIGPIQTDPDTNRTPIESIIIRVKGVDVPVKTEDFDAIFWSTAALEKFAVPYYARLFDGRTAQRIRDKFADDANAYAVAHKYGTDESVCRVNEKGQTERFL